jgi:transcriptional regulator with XRE-family HTH domain
MSTGSIVVRRSLGRRLKQLREGAGKTYGDVAELQISKAKLARIEAGQVPVKVPDVRTLAWHYGADEATTEQLVDLALNTAEKGWWEPFSKVMPSWFTTYVELESFARQLLTYQSDLVPGLLQTPEYHRAVFAADPLQSAADAERTVELRIERQRSAFERPDPLRITAVLSQGVLARQVGGEAVMAEQRQHLCQLATRPNVSIHVLPWTAGAHPALKGSFTVLGFDGTDHQDVAYLETRLGGRHIWEEDQVGAYLDDHSAIVAQSIPIKEFL